MDGILRKVAIHDEEFAALIEVDTSGGEEPLAESLQNLESRLDVYFDDDCRARLIELLKDPELLSIAEGEYTDDFPKQLEKVMEKYDLLDEINLLFDGDDDDDDDDDYCIDYDLIEDIFGTDEDDDFDMTEQKISRCMNDPEYDRIMADRNAKDFRQKLQKLLRKYDLEEWEDVFLDEE